VFSRDPLRNPEILKPKTYSVTRTIVRQIATFFLGLLIGLGITYFLTWVANHHTIQFTDGSTIGFGFYGEITFVTFCISLIGGIYWQHENSPSSVQVKQTWKYHALVIGSFSGFMTLLGLLMTELASVVLIILYQIALVLHLSLIIVNVQGFVLKRMAFNEDNHRWLMSAEANYWACKARVLPYRETVIAIWRMIGTFVFTLILIGIIVFANNTIHNPDTVERILIYLIFPTMIGLLILGFIIAWESLIIKKFRTVEGKIAKSMTPRGYRTPATYTIHCNGRNFPTENYLWSGMYEGVYYRLWYLPAGFTIKMIAFEKIPEPQTVNEPISVADIKDTLPQLKQLEQRGRNPTR
jgi:hypothetical protein